MSYLMVISVGPVQEFIASARRSRDLWFGSWLLSELSKAAACSIVKEHGNDLKCLIFPKPETPADLNEGSPFNVVNKIVALIDKPPSEIGEAARLSINARLEAIREKAFGEIEDRAGYFHRGAAEKQVSDLIDYCWAASPLDDPNDEAQYTKARSLSEELLAARRSTRNFQPVLPRPEGWAANVPKSSLDGLRESVIDERAFDALGQAQLQVRYGVRKRERLCGVGLLKRHGNRAGDDSFFSTSHVAALPLLQTLDDHQAVTDYVHALTALLVIIDKKELRKVFGKIPDRASHPAFLDYDGHLLFEDRLTEFFEGEDLEKAKQALRRFLDRACGGSQPNPYYSLILADGDHMGRTIDEQRNFGRHRQLSGRLTAFAKSVQSIVEIEHQGSLVYAGGDDVLAFLPLHTVLPCARALAQKFNSQMSEFQVHGDDGGKLVPTLSVGIAISHHIEPLSDALQMARQAERAAKSVNGKNALAITFRKRSGTDRTVKGRWGELDQRLDRFVLLHRAEAIPDGAAYELRDLDVRLEGVKRAVLEAEAMRILKRKRIGQGRSPIAERVLSELNESIGDPDLSLKQLADELIIAGELAKATRQAGIEPEMLPSARDQKTPSQRTTGE